MEPAEIHAGINITPGKFQLVELERYSERFRILNVDEVQFNQQIDFETEIESEINLKLQSAFDKIQQSTTLRTGSFSFSLPPGLFYFYQTPYDNTMVHNDLIEEFRWELSVLFPFVNVNNLGIQYLEIEKNPVININTAIIFALPRKFLQILKIFCSANHYQLKFIEASNIAAERSVLYSDEKLYDGITASINISSNVISLILSSNGKIVYQNNLKTEYLPDAMDFINAELKSSGIKKINRNILSRVYLSGQKVDNEIVNNIKNITNQPPVVFNPFKTVSAIPAVSDNHFFNSLNNSFAAAAGSAYRIAG